MTLVRVADCPNGGLEVVSVLGRLRMFAVLTSAVDAGGGAAITLNAQRIARAEDIKRESIASFW